MSLKNNKQTASSGDVLLIFVTNNREPTNLQFFDSIPSGCQVRKNTLMSHFLEVSQDDHNDNGQVKLILAHGTAPTAVQLPRSRQNTIIWGKNF